MSTETVQRKVFYKDENFSLEYERLIEIVYVHLIVNRFLPSVMRKIYREAVRFEDQMRQEGVKKITTYTPNPAFAKLFLGDECSKIEHQGITYVEFVWDLTRQQSVQ